MSVCNFCLTTCFYHSTNLAFICHFPKMKYRNTPTHPRLLHIPFRLSIEPRINFLNPYPVCQNWMLLAFARPACTSMQSDQALYCWLTKFKFSS